MVFASVLNVRIYRAAFLPLLFALAIAGFSLADRPAPLTSTLAPDAFAGAHALAESQQLATLYPGRRPGSAGDLALAAYIAGELRSLGGMANGGFTVQESSSEAQTIAGRRTLRTVVARRAGTTGAGAIVIVAHRDAASAAARSELSATAVLLALARVFATSETRRTIVLVSTSGGSGGNAGAADFAAHATAWADGPVDCAIVLGDLAAASSRPPALAPFSDTPGSAPELLQRTVAQALAAQLGRAPASPTLLERLAQLTFPLPAGEQGPLNARGLPAVLVQAGGELPPAAAVPVNAGQLEVLGRGVLASVYALDAGPDIAPGAAGVPETSLPVARKLLPAWAVSLLVLTLLLPPLLTAGDGLARLRRQRLLAPASGVSLARATAWVAACGLPFLLCALFVFALGALDAFPAPRPPVAPAALPLGDGALLAALAAVLLFALAWLLWPAALRRIALPLIPDGATGAPALVLVLGALALLVWAIDPFTALLFVPALHLWLLLAAPAAPAARRGGLAPVLAAVALAVLGAVPLALLVAFYAHHFALGPGGVAHTALLLLASGRVGLAGAVLWSLAAGCLAAALLLALGSARAGSAGPPPAASVEPRHDPVTIRGPLSYAGPGSLGGTESALPR